MSHSRHRILVVDDEPNNRKLLFQILQDTYQPAFAVNGEQALEITKQIQPDLILLDIMMPGMDGYHVCQKLKSDTRTCNIPIIFITAMTAVEDEALGFEVGCADYITKPFSPSIVLARVKTQLELRDAFETMAAQNKKLIQAAKLREEVERITRHDLKNPLTGIFSGVDLLEDMEGLSPNQKEILDIIKGSAHRMLQMINSSLDLFKMEQKIYRLKLVEVDLIRIILRIEKEFHSLIELKQTEIIIRNEGPSLAETGKFMVKAEDLLIYSMMSNLIKNAVEATPKTENISVTLSKKDSQAVICIHNNGCVPREIKPVFFEKYTTSGKAKGSGIGTYSARLIAQTLGGSIHMDSSEEQGTRISILLPD
ncbi:MAG: response regulator [Desulfobacteraceae bacterium]|nr:response regulator [Desulfobacteraceae bacterium]